MIQNAKLYDEVYYLDRTRGIYKCKILRIVEINGALVLCFSESSLNYEANHQGLYDGVCGVNPYYWEDYLSEQDIPLNSIQAGYAVYQFYLEQTGDRNKALKKFKGIQSKSNNWIIKKVRRVTKEVKQLHLKD